ncbi:MAG: glycosyltransferase family 4 protein [Aeromicrobium sp.]|nr:glycosyltransferase family 4 protein [Burkholderiales bacterium]
MDDSRIRLLFIVSSLVFGGAEKHAVTLANTLDCRRYRLSLAYLKDDATLLPQIDRTNLDGGVFCCHVARKVDSAAVQTLADHVRDERIDAIVCVNTYPLLYATLAARRARMPVKLIEVFHTTELGGVDDQLQMLFYRPFIRLSDQLVYVCKNQRQYWRRRLLRARRDCVIHNGVDISHFDLRQTECERQQVRQRFGFGKADYLIGLCAAMRPEKAHGDLLQALARLRNAGVQAKCLLIGDGPERGRIEAQISALNLREHVRITGFESDVRPTIGACDVMTIVSHHVETFSIATLEAMAMGKPMVMSRIGGANEQIEHGKNGYLFAKGDIAALTGALTRLQHRPHAESMGQLARDTIERQFSLAVMVDAYDRLFSGMVNAYQVERGNIRVA